MGTSKFSDLFNGGRNGLPMKLAFHIAFHLTQHVVKLGWTPPSTELQPPDDVSYQYLRAITGVQPKSSKIPPIVSEFAYLADFDICQSLPPPILPGEKLQKEWNGIPAGACLLKKPPLRLNGGKDLQPGMKRLTFGVFRTCDQFVEAAVAAGHPVNKESRLPSVLHEAVNFVTSHSLKDIAKHRLDSLKYWLERARALRTDESELHACLPAPLKSILAPKRLLLWKEMMEFMNTQISKFMTK